MIEREELGVFDINMLIKLLIIYFFKSYIILFFNIQIYLISLLYLNRSIPAQTELDRRIRTTRPKEDFLQLCCLKYSSPKII